MTGASRIQIPEEFRQLVRCADFARDLEPGGDEIGGMIGGLTERQREAVKAFLTDLLARNPTEEELEKIWTRSSNTANAVSGARHFFTELRDRL